MKRVSFIMIILTSVLSSLAAKTFENRHPAKNTIHIQSGIYSGYFRDLVYSPLNYNSSGLALSTGYQLSLKNQDCLLISANARLGKLKTEVSEFNSADHYNLNLDFGYMSNILNNASGFRFLIGGQYHIFYDISLFEATEAVTFYGLHSIDVVGSITWDISARHSFGTTLSLPVFGLLIRPKWTGWDKYIIEHETNLLPVFFRGRWTSFNDFLAINWDLKYTFSIGSRWNLTAEYQFRYYMTNMPEKAIIPSNQFAVGTSFSF
jgi:hypothetical protein